MSSLFNILIRPREMSRRVNMIYVLMFILCLSLEHVTDYF
jgi:hypothetical protein